ncbi:hypothetical protein NIES4071_38770 [Calothrix sp. NIES-4071]|nr:hypothetical protein NIES4071_38770 [Calothrix sp. NIES-4071]BAZ58195.1 hypothetical protein NIES4105_38710 [Calothrix sp. NIES-4105]
MFEEHLLAVRKNTSTVRYIIKTNEVSRKTAFAENAATKPVTQEGTELLVNSQENIPSIQDWRLYDHCSVVTRLYAVYERFVEDLVKDWLKIIPKLFPLYLHLDERIKNTHQTGVARLLLELKKNRYENLGLEKVVGSLFYGVTNQEYELVPEAFLFHEQNLRREILDKLLADAGIINAWSWLDKHRNITKFLEEVRENEVTAEKELNDLIIFRNQAAHGASPVILDYPKLLELCDFIDILCEAITELVTYRVIQYQLSVGQAREIGEITEWFKKQQAGVVKTEATNLSVGENLFLANETIFYCQLAIIQSIRINDNAVEQVQTTPGMEVGLRFNIDARKGLRLYQIQSGTHVNSQK